MQEILIGQHSLVTLIEASTVAHSPPGRVSRPKKLLRFDILCECVSCASARIPESRVLQRSFRYRRLFAARLKAQIQHSFPYVPFDVQDVRPRVPALTGGETRRQLLAEPATTS